MWQMRVGPSMLIQPSFIYATDSVGFMSPPYIEGDRERTMSLEPGLASNDLSKTQSLNLFKSHSNKIRSLYLSIPTSSLYLVLHFGELNLCLLGRIYSVPLGSTDPDNF